LWDKKVVVNQGHHKASQFDQAKAEFWFPATWLEAHSLLQLIFRDLLG
jgi:hypothetical protein